MTRPELTDCLRPRVRQLPRRDLSLWPAFVAGAFLGAAVIALVEMFAQ